MLDKTVPYIGFIMIKTDIENYPKFELPEGYEIVFYKEGDEKHWALLELSVEEFDNYETALDYFTKEFMPRKDILHERCIFIKASNGEFAATASVWKGNHFNEERDRIHWVSVHPDHQGKGLAKVILSKAMEVMNEVSSSKEAYLTTQTNSYKAINIYRKFGFKQYLGEKPDGWQCQSTWEKDQIDARNIIDKKILEYENNKRT